MQYTSTMSLLGLFVVVLVVVVAGARGQDLVSDNSPFSTNILSLVSNLRPATSVVSAARAAAPGLFVSMSERLQRWGYPLESHAVRTEDGYLLTLHRIPRGRRHAGPGEANAVDGAAAPRTRPVLLVHGFIGCSEEFVLAGPGVAPALTLADRGYDVWLLNMRGNHFSLKHERLPRRDRRFWMFSWHEIGIYDVPAVIDYVLNVTKHDRLISIAHSMGNLIFYVTMSMKPEYNSKVSLNVNLAPAVFLDHLPMNLIRVAVDNADYLKVLLESLTIHELLPRSNSLIVLFHQLCGEEAYFNKFCAVVYSLIMGSTDLNNTTDLCLRIARGLSSTSTRILMDYLQLVRSDEFRQVDYGAAKNMRVYGTSQPPEYPLQKVTVPQVIILSEKDALAPPEGILKLAKTLPNVVSTHVINEKFFNHMEFIYHPKINELYLDDLLKTMARY